MTKNKILGAIVVDTERCKGCALCVEACPHDVIALAEKKVNVHGYRYVALCLEHNHTCRLPRLEERKGLNDFCLWSDRIAKEAIRTTSDAGMGYRLIAFH